MYVLVQSPFLRPTGGTIAQQILPIRQLERAGCRWVAPHRRQYSLRLHRHLRYSTLSLYPIQVNGRIARL